MNLTESIAIFNNVKNNCAAGTTILIVEHNVKAVFNLCQRIVVLHFGKKINEGSIKDVICHKEVTKAYLGGDNYMK
jgi:ABC-type branched-subunit amino acid transport system ATPase component